MHVTLIVVVKVPYRTVLVITFEHISNVDGGSIQPVPILPDGIFTRNKTNMTSIGAIAVDGVTGELVYHHHPQSEKHAHTIVFSVEHQQVAIPKWMQFATVSIIAGPKANKNYFYRYYFNVM